MREEKDFLGTLHLPKQALYGIHALRAKENFPYKMPFPIEWYKAMGEVKKSCYSTYRQLKNEVQNCTDLQDSSYSFFSDDLIDALEFGALEVAQGLHFDQFIVTGISGGAGTSVNMNINEIITNLALKSLGFNPGQYEIIDPIEQANVFQSTNDVVPTALKVAVMKCFNKLEVAINKLRNHVEGAEKKFRNILRVGHTQLQEAVPSSYGKLLSTYSDALSRDWWRVSKCLERIKVVNLGGSAIGTGMTVPRYFIYQNIKNLRLITSLPLTLGENLMDATSNLDSFVEVGATIKSHAVNLEKMSNDLRLLSSDLSTAACQIPARQVGSSIMPGKINPVIVEYVISCCHRIYGNDQVITSLCARGDFELNAYLPLIGVCLIENLEMLMTCNQVLGDFLFLGLKVDGDKSMDLILRSPVCATALVPYKGYHDAAQLAQFMKENSVDIYTANQELNLVSQEFLQSLMTPEKLLALGFSFYDEMKGRQ